MLSLGTGLGTSNIKLAQDIQDEFLVCKICLEQYKTPKCLACLHTFCENCIETHALSETSYKKYSDYRDFTCPLCRKRTQLPTGGVKKLPDNFLVSSLQDMVNRQRPNTSYPFCDICRMLNRRHRDALAKCIDCSKLLCRMCSDQHRETRVTKNHSLIDIDTEKDIECKEHKDELVRFYCMPCECAICILCTVSDHKEHEISSFPEAVSRFKDDINSSLDHCKEKLGQLENRLTLLGSTSSNVEETEQVIRDAAINFISEIRTREKALLEDLRSLFGGLTTEELQKKKQELQTEVDSLRSTCSLAEIVLKGRDLELLMLKKQVQEKLKALASIDTKTLFLQNVFRVEFMPGSVDLGSLHQVDNDEDDEEKQSSDLEYEEPAAPVLQPELVIAGRFSRASADNIIFPKESLSPNTILRSSSYNFEVNGNSDKFPDVNECNLLKKIPGSDGIQNLKEPAEFMESSTQTTTVNRRERGITAIVLTDMSSKSCQVDPNEVAETFANLTEEDLENDIICLTAHLPGEDEYGFVDGSSQTEIVHLVDASVNTRCRVVQRQNNSSSQGAALPQVAPIAVGEGFNESDGNNSISSPRSESSCL